MTLADLAWAIEDLKARLPGYALAREYDKGNHRLLFATQKYQNTFGALFREFADNLCDDVCDALADRLQVQSWSSVAATTARESLVRSGGDVRQSRPEDKDPLSEAVDTFWVRTQGDSRMGGVRRNAIREGDGFAMVQVDREQKSHIYKQRPEQMAVRYDVDRPDQIEVAAKVWRSGGRYRANLYYPDGLIERYGTRGLGAGGALPQAKAFRKLEAGDPDLPEDVDSYADEDADRGMPVFHYPNGEVSEYGQSVVLKVVPLQDALNKSVTDMLVAMEFHAYPQRWATGVEVEYAQGPDGTLVERKPFQAGEGRVWRVGSKEAEFGQFASGDLDGFRNVQSDFRLEIARKGYLAPHSISLTKGGEVPSGISLLVAEGRTVKWARDRQRDWGLTDREMVAYALTQEMAETVTAADLHLEWVPPETRDMKALLEELVLKSDLGVPDKQLLQEAGYPLEMVLDFLDAKGAESEADALARETLTGGRPATTRADALALAQGPQPAQV